MTEQTSNHNDLIKPSPKNILIKVDFLSVAKLLFFLLVIIFLYLIRDIIILFLGAVILSLIFSPIVDILERKKVPRLLSTVLIYLLLLVILVGVVVPLIPVFSRELNFLIQKIPDYYNQINQYFSVSDKNLSEVIQNLISKWFSQPGLTTKGIFNILGTVFGWIFVVIMIFVLSFYLTVQKQALKETIKKIVPEKYKTAVVHMIDLIQKDVGGWARGLVMGALFIGIVNYIGFTIMGIKFALLLAFLAMIGELIPWIGPWVVGILSVLVALIQSPLQAIMVAVFYFLAEQLEGNLIYPKIMQKMVRLDPLLVILVLLIGAKLGGGIGIILSVPILTIIIILVKEYWHIKKEDFLNK